MSDKWKKYIQSYDDRRDIVIPGNMEETLKFCVEHFLEIAEKMIQQKGIFTVALSGGTTPKAIFQLLASQTYRSRIDWGRVLLFWSDERCVPPDHPDSNYFMAMESGLATLPILKEHIFPMPADSPELNQAAKAYEQLIQEYIPSGSFDLTTLGMGEDGHTASLFPKTHGLHTEDGLVIANFLPQKNIWRMTLTYDCINNSHEIAIYVLGKSKAETVKKVLTSSYEPDTLPIQRIGTRLHKALWIMDNDAASAL